MTLRFIQMFLAKLAVSLPLPRSIILTAILMIASEMVIPCMVMLLQAMLNQNSAEPVPTNMDLPAGNPIAYAYQLLETSGEFPEATWNV